MKLTAVLKEKIRSDRGLLRRVERKPGLEPHQGVEDEQSADVKEQHGNRIGGPVLLAAFVDPAEPVEACLERTQNRREQCSLAVEHMRHVGAQRHHERGDDGAEQQNLNPADDGHDR